MVSSLQEKSESIINKLSEIINFCNLENKLNEEEVIEQRLKLSYLNRDLKELIFDFMNESIKVIER